MIIHRPGPKNTLGEAGARRVKTLKGSDIYRKYIQKNCATPMGSNDVLSIMFAINM